MAVTSESDGRPPTVPAFTDVNALLATATAAPPSGAVTLRLLWRSADTDIATVVRAAADAGPHLPRTR
jgi:hypothetical protein